MNKKLIFSIIIFISLIFSSLLFFYISKNSSIPFNHDVWVESNNIDEFPVREKMAKNLISKRTLIGKSLDEIDQLLGQASISLDNENMVYYEISEEKST